MSDGRRTLLLNAAVLLFAIIIFNLPVAQESIAVRAIGIFPLLCIGLSQVLFRYPRFTARSMDQVVERDASRGTRSIYHVGLLMLVLGPLIAYMLFFR